MWGSGGRRSATASLRRGNRALARGPGLPLSPAPEAWAKCGGGLVRCAEKRTLHVSAGYMTRSRGLRRVAVSRRPGAAFPSAGHPCPDSGARHPWRACRDARPPGHGSPWCRHRRFGCQSKEAATVNRQRGVPTGVCGEQAMDGLRRRVRHGRLPSRGACPGRDDAVSEARVQTSCLGHQKNARAGRGRGWLAEPRFHGNRRIGWWVTSP